MTDTPVTWSRFNYDQHARSCEPDDFLGQTKRTIGGQPMGADQIDMILDAIVARLALQPTDAVLELACGNGLLSHRLFGACAAWHGSDISPYLISVAQREFARPPHYRFSEAGALEFLQTTPEPERYTKALCYAGLQYFPDADAVAVLRCLHERFPGIVSVFIGNHPDRERSAGFFRQHHPTDAELDDCQTALGRWRTAAQLHAIAAEAGWHSRIERMPDNFHGTAYRFDVVLSRSGSRS